MSLQNRSMSHLRKIGLSKTIIRNAAWSVTLFTFSLVAAGRLRQAHRVVLSIMEPAVFAKQTHTRVS